MLYRIRVDSERFSRFLRLFKLGSVVNIRATSKSLKFRNIDLRDFSGVLDGVLVPLESSNLDFSIEPTLFLEKLDKFKEQITMEIDDISSVVQVYSKEKSYRFNLECNLGKRVSSDLSLNLVRGAPLASFTIDTASFLESTDVVTSVDNVLKLQLRGSNLTLSSRRMKNISHQILGLESLKDLKVGTLGQFAQIYYNTGVFNQFLRRSKTLLVSLYQDFLVLKGNEMLDEDVTSLEAYIPLRTQEELKV